MDLSATDIANRTHNVHRAPEVRWSNRQALQCRAAKRKISVHANESRAQIGEVVRESRTTQRIQRTTKANITFGESQNPRVFGSRRGYAGECGIVLKFVDYSALHEMQ